MRGSQSRAVALLALAACGFASDPTPAAAHGGGSYTPMTITQGPYPLVYYGLAGEAARLDMRLTDAPPTELKGQIALHEVVAAHQLQAVAARVLLAPVKGRAHELPVGTVLSRVFLGEGQARAVWCDLRDQSSWWGGASFDCLSDTKNAGSFDQAWLSGTLHGLTAVESGAVNSPVTLETPAAYREARPDERPVFQLGVQWCDGDGAVKPARFSLAVRFPPSQKWLGLGCGAEHTAPSTKNGVVTFGSVRVTLTPAQDAEHLAYAVDGRFAPMEALAPIGRDSELRAVGAPTPPKSPSAVSRLKSLVSTGALPTLATQPVTKGEALFTAPVRHGLTGMLAAPVKAATWFSEHTLPAGQTVYGVDLGGAGRGEIVWCAPTESAQPDPRKKTRWTAICLAPSPEGDNAVWLDGQTGMMSVSVVLRDGVRTSEHVQVTPGPVALPAMTLAYRFEGWTEQGGLIVDEVINWGEGPQSLRAVKIAAAADGSVTLRTMGGAFRVRKGVDALQAAVELVQPFDPAAPVVY